MNIALLTSNFSTNIVEGLTVTVIGVVIVMSVLILISISLSLLKFVGSDTKKEQKAVEAKPVSQPVTVKEADVVPVTDDTELIAVITGAIACSLNTSTDKLIVRSIKKVPKWNNNAILKNHNNF